MMNYILKGDFIYTNEKKQLIEKNNCFCIVEDGISLGIFDKIPSKYSTYELKDYTGRVITPGLIDLHLHAPQYNYRGVGGDKELLDWLNTYTFPEEAKFKDLEYANKSYDILVDDLKKSFTTRAVIFSSIHLESSLLLADKLEKSGLITYVGKVNMDRNSPDYYIESTAESTLNTISFLRGMLNFKRTFSIITPRFVPTCSDSLLKNLGEIVSKYKVPVQSHLSENRGEIDWVSNLNKKSKFYGDAYDMFGLFGTKSKTIMAHCVSSSKEEIELMKKQEVYIAHCPSSNENLASGIAPVKMYLEKGLNVGIGTDFAGGHHISVFDEMCEALQVSKLHFRYIDQERKPLTIAEVLYMATLGGGKFFGKVGSFEAGYSFDAIVLDDSSMRSAINFTLKERLERIIHISSEVKLVNKFVAGREIK